MNVTLFPPRPAPRWDDMTSLLQLIMIDRDSSSTLHYLPSATACSAHTYPPRTVQYTACGGVRSTAYHPRLSTRLHQIETSREPECVCCNHGYRYGSLGPLYNRVVHLSGADPLVVRFFHPSADWMSSPCPHFIAASFLSSWSPQRS